MPEIPNILGNFKSQIVGYSAEAVMLILREYADAIRRIQQDLDQLSRVIEQLKAQNRIVSENDIFTQLRYRQFLNQLRQEMRDYATFVTDVVSFSQREAIASAFAQTEAIMAAAYRDLPKGMLQSFTRFDEFAVRNIVFRLNNESYLRTLTRQFEQHAVLAVKNTLIDGVITGRSIKEIKHEFVTQLDIVPTRAETIARTEIISAYRDANLERYRHSSAVKGWQWSATLDHRTCAMCIAMDGQVFPLSVPFATHPSCRCSPIPVLYTFQELGLGYLGLQEPVPPDFGKRGEEWFKSQPLSVQENILGKSKFELYRTNQINLQDLVQEFRHPVYGASRQERSIRSMRSLQIVK